jgi:hypothetical protein
MHTTLGSNNMTQDREVEASRRGALATAPPPHAPRRRAAAGVNRRRAYPATPPRRRTRQAAARVTSPQPGAQHDRHSTARATTVAAPRAARPWHNRTRNDRCGTARGTTVAVPHATRSSRYRTSDRHRPRLHSHHCRDQPPSGLPCHATAPPHASSHRTCHVTAARSATRPSQHCSRHDRHSAARGTAVTAPHVARSPRHRTSDRHCPRIRRRH